ncbi:MAG: hypothetical protein AAFV80_23735, partial [Bacteroidota bacterium]
MNDELLWTSFLPTEVDGRVRFSSRIFYTGALFGEMDFNSETYSYNHVASILPDSTAFMANPFFRATPDGGYLLFARLSFFPNNMIFKFDANDNLEWYTYYEAESRNVFIQDAMMDDNGDVYIIPRHIFITTFRATKLDPSEYIYPSTVQGNITSIGNAACGTGTPQALSGWNITAQSLDRTVSAKSDLDGNYKLVLRPGNYTVKVNPPLEYWRACEGAMDLTIGTSQQIINQDFTLFQEFDCPYLEVDIGATFLRRCFDNIYQVQVCNTGTSTAVSPELSIDLDPAISYTSSSIIPDQFDGQNVRYFLDDLAPGACIRLSLTGFLDCNADLSRSHCTQAQVTPNDLCASINPVWDQSSTHVEVLCETDSVRFILQNLGLGNMQTMRSFIVWENDQ